MERGALSTSDGSRFSRSVSFVLFLSISTLVVEFVRRKSALSKATHEKEDVVRPSRSLSHQDAPENLPDVRVTRVLETSSHIHLS